MTKNQPKTKQRILAVACELFAHRGYRGTTTEDICQEAGANIAAVHYHYQSKEKLYLAVWDRLADENQRRRDDRLDRSASPQEQLRQFIQTEAEAVLSEGPTGFFVRLMHREMSNPTQVHEELRTRYAEPTTAFLHNLVRQILGDSADESLVHQAGFCIYSPLLHLMEMPSKTRRRRCHLKNPEPLIDTLTLFALGGLEKLKSTQAITPSDASTNKRGS